MLSLLFGYFVMALLFFVVRFFYHILPKKSFRDNLIRAVKNDFTILYVYRKCAVKPPNLFVGIQGAKKIIEILNL